MSGENDPKVTVVIRLEVEDFDRWKVGFDAIEPIRSEAGLSAEAYRVAGAPKQVWVIGTAPSKEAFFSFFSTPEQQERMKAMGVLAPPEVTFLESA